MTSTYRDAPHLGRPVERHKLTAAAQAARDAVAGRRAAERAELVTKHRRPVEQTEQIPAGATRLAEKAQAAGFEVKVSRGEWTLNRDKSNERHVASVKVEGLHRGRRVGFRAIWAGSPKLAAALGLWYDGRNPTRLPDDVGVTEVGARV